MITKEASNENLFEHHISGLGTQEETDHVQKKLLQNLLIYTRTFL